MKIYCINLKRSPERRAKMESELKKTVLEYGFIDAVDGRALSEEELNRKYSPLRTRLRCGSGLSHGEVGCALSHVEFFKKVLAGNLDCALVLEDDVSLGENFVSAVEEVEQFLSRTKEPTLVHLPGIPRDLHQSEDGRFVPASGGMGNYAYAINRSAAEVFIRCYTPVMMPMDKYDYVIRHYGLKFFSYPRIVLSVDMAGESTIGKDRFLVVKGAMKFAYKVWRCIGVALDAILSRKDWR